MTLADILTEGIAEIDNLAGPGNVVAARMAEARNRLEHPADVLDLNHAYGPRFRAFLGYDNERQVLVVHDYGEPVAVGPVAATDFLVGLYEWQAVATAKRWIEERLESAPTREA